MSETLASGSANKRQVLRKKCGRSIILQAMEDADGNPAPPRLLDMEVISVVGYPGGHVVMRGRRLHGELCYKYQAELDRKRKKNGRRR